MTLPAKFQENIDWVNQPPPTNARDTHALHFWLSDTDGDPTYQGLMFYRPRASPSSIITQRQNGIQGKGFLIPTLTTCQRVVGSPGTPRPGPWIRIQVTWRTTTSGPFPLNANLVFHDIRQDPPDNLPGAITSEVVFDRVEPVSLSGDVISGDVILTPGSGPSWKLDLTKTTVSLGE